MYKRQPVIDPLLQILPQADGAHGSHGSVVFLLHPHVFRYCLLYTSIVSSNLFEGNRDIFLNSTVYQSLFEKMALEPDKIFTLPSRLNYAHGQEGDLILSRAVSDSSKVLGYLFFDLSDEQIYETVRNYPLDDVILTDRYDNLIFSIGRQSADPMEKYPAGKYRMEWEKGNVVRVNGKHYHVQKEMLPESTLVPVSYTHLLFNRILMEWVPSPRLTTIRFPCCSKSPAHQGRKNWYWGVMTPPSTGIRMVPP